MNRKTIIKILKCMAIVWILVYLGLFIYFFCGNSGQREDLWMAVEALALLAISCGLLVAIKRSGSDRE